MYNKYIVLIITLFLNVSLSYSQETDKKISFSVRETSLKEIIRILEADTRFSFVYDSGLNLSQITSVEIKEQPLTSALNLVFDGTGILWEIKGEHIVLKEESRKYTVSGYVMDKTTKETLIGASIMKKNTGRGTLTNSYGYYTYTLPPGKVELQISYVGYQNQTVSLDMEKDTTLSVQLEESAWLNEVVIDEKNNKPFSPHAGVMELTPTDIKNTPTIMGEVDVIKTLQLLPGVQTGVEGTAGLYVRGGGPDQNLTLLDGVNVYNINHVYGLFSIFNGDAIKKVTLYKGSFPARFGGRLSSVVDIRLKDGNMQKYSGDISIGLISSHLNIEGPILKDKTSFSISVRRTYIDAFLRLADHFTEDIIPTIYFYDINAKFNHKFSGKSRLYLSIYNGMDKMGSNLKEKQENILNEKISYGWGNTIAALRWNYVWSSGLFSNITVAYNRYHFDFKTNSTFRSKGNEEDSFYYQYQNKQHSGIKDWIANADFEYIPHDNHYIRFGAGYIYHTFQPEVQSTRQFETIEKDTISNTHYDYLSEKMKAHETSLYAEDEISIGNHWKTNIGVHFSTFSIDKKTYWSLQPRVSLGYQQNEKLSFKASYSEMSQYIHLLSSSILALPTDLWVPVTPTLPPMDACQITLGGFYDTREGYNFSVEGFYKWMDNMLEYKEGAEWSSRFNPWYEQVESGKGETYGVEFFAQKTTGKWTGWMGYTLAWNNRKFPTINAGKTYPAKYDRRHDIKINATYRLKENIDISAAWSFSSGNTYTLALEEYPSVPNYFIMPEHYGWKHEDDHFGEEQWIERYEERNNYRIPPTHHLDLSLNYYRKKDEKGRQGIWNFTIYNVYNQPCPYLIYPGFSEKKGVNVLKQVSLLPILPSVSYTYKF